MRYLQKTVWETGEVVRTPVCTGRPRTLDSLDANVSYLLCLDSLIHELYVSSLRHVLNDNQIFYSQSCKINCGKFARLRP